MTHSILAHHSLLALSLVATACTFPVKAGDNPDEQTTDDPSTGEPTSGEPTTGAPTSAAPTTGEPSTQASEPGVCGDGVVDIDEACDDGNDEPLDGCDSTCARAATVEWTYAPTDLDFASDLAVDATGRSILVSDNKVIALGPDGVEQWRKTLEGSGSLLSVEIDEQGAIYLGSATGMTHRLTPDGDEQWRSDTGLPIHKLALGHAALYSVGLDPSGEVDRLVVRRHDRDTGATAWSTFGPDDIEVRPDDIAVTGPHVVVAGFWAALGGGVTRPLLAVLDATGTLQPLDLDGVDGRVWHALAPTGAGGLVLAGIGPTADVVVGRLGADLSTQWTAYEADSPGTRALAVASGPADALAIAGVALELDGAFVRRLDPTGATLWTAFFTRDVDGYQNQPAAIAFGPDFILALGNEQADEDLVPRMWVRRFALD